MSNRNNIQQNSHIDNTTVAFFVISTGGNLKIIDLTWLLVSLLSHLHDLAMLASAIFDLYRSLSMASQVFGWQFEIIFKSFVWGIVGVKL